MGADLALFPELWSIGYGPDLMVAENILEIESEFIQAFIAQAKNLEMTIAITYLGMGAGGKPTNNVAVIDRTGTVGLDYAKVNICSFAGGTEVALEPGKNFKTVRLEYAGGKVNLGAMICFDREFPESARALAQMLRWELKLFWYPTPAIWFVTMFLAMFGLHNCVAGHLKIW